MYRVADGTMYRVRPSRQSGRLYAMRFDVVSYEFTYAPGVIYKLTASDRMTLEEAMAWGVQTGVCCVCGAFLTDEKSVARGIGPVCAKGF